MGIREDFAAQGESVRRNFEGMYGASAPYFWAAQSGRLQVPPEAQEFYNLDPKDQATWYGVHGENAAVAWLQEKAGRPGASPAAPAAGGYGQAGTQTNPGAGVPYKPGQSQAYPTSNVVPGSGRGPSGETLYGTTQNPFRGGQPGTYTNRLGEMPEQASGGFGSGFFDAGGNRHFIGRDDEGGPLGYGEQQMATQRNAATGKMEEASIRLGRQDSGWDPQANNGRGGPRNTTGAYYGAQPFSFISGRGGLNGLPAAGEGSWVGLNKSFGSGGQGDPTDGAGRYDESGGYAGAGGQENWNRWVRTGRGGGVNPVAGALARQSMGGGAPSAPSAPSAQSAMGPSRYVFNSNASGAGASGGGGGMNPLAGVVAQPPSAMAPAGPPQQPPPAEPMQEPQPLALPYYQTGYATGGGSNTPGAPAGVGGGPTPTAQLFVGPGVNLEGDWAVLGNLLLRSDTESSLNTSGIPREYGPLIARAIQLGVVRVTNRGWDFLKKVFGMTPASIGGVAPNLAALVGVQADGSGAGTADYGGQVDANTIGYGTQINGGGVTNGNVTAPPGTTTPGTTGPANTGGVSGTYAEGEQTPLGPIKGGMVNGFDLEFNKLLADVKYKAGLQAIEEAKLSGVFNGMPTLDAQKLAADIKDQAEKNAIAKINADANMKAALTDEAYKQALTKYNQDKLAQDAGIATGYLDGKATVDMQRLLAEQQQAAYARAANPAMAFENEYARGATGWNTGNTAGAVGVPGLTAPGQTIDQFGQSGAWAPGGTPTTQPVQPTPAVQAYPATQAAAAQAAAPAAQQQTGASSNIFAGQSENQPSVQPTAGGQAGVEAGLTVTDDTAPQAPTTGVNIRTPAAVQAFKQGTGISSSGNYGSSTGQIEDSSVAPVSSSQVRLQNLKQTRKLSPVARAVVGSFAKAGGVDEETQKLYANRGAPGTKSTTGAYSLK